MAISFCYYRVNSRCKSAMFSYSKQVDLWTNNSNDSRQRMVLRPISSHGIEQDVPHMNLVGIKVKSPDGPVVLDEENDVGNRPARDRHGEDVPHLAGIPSIAWSLELDLAQYLEYSSVPYSVSRVCSKMSLSPTAPLPPKSRLKIGKGKKACGSGTCS